MAHDGLGPTGATSPCARCRDCFGCSLQCSRCTLETHQQMPLHHLEVSSLSLSFLIMLIIDSAVERHLFRTLNTARIRTKGLPGSQWCGVPIPRQVQARLRRRRYEWYPFSRSRYLRLCWRTSSSHTVATYSLASGVS